jgi:hypothetical protein
MVPSYMARIEVLLLLAEPGEPLNQKLKVGLNGTEIDILKMIDILKITSRH